MANKRIKKKTQKHLAVAMAATAGVLSAAGVSQVSVQAEEVDRVTSSLVVDLPPVAEQAAPELTPAEEPLQDPADKSLLTSHSDSLASLLEQTVELSQKTGISQETYQTAEQDARAVLTAARAVLDDAGASQEQVDDLARQVMSRTVALAQAMEKLEAAASKEPSSSPETEDTGDSQESAALTSPEAELSSPEETEKAPVRSRRDTSAVSDEAVSGDAEAAEPPALPEKQLIVVTKDGEPPVVKQGDQRYRTIKILFRGFSTPSIVKLLAVNDDTNLTNYIGYAYSQNSDPELSFHFNALNPGTYRVKVGLADDPSVTGEISYVIKSEDDYEDWVSNENRPYITIERYWGNNTVDKNYTVKKNGTVDQVVYKMGLTRITDAEVELTPDAKLLGFTYDSVKKEITGTLDYKNPALKAATYSVGLQSKADPSMVFATAFLTIAEPKTFIIRVMSNLALSIDGDRVREFGDAFSLVSSGYGVEYSEEEGYVEGIKLKIKDKDDSENRTLVYYAIAPTTPFGYYISNNPSGDKTVADASPTTPQYRTGFQLLHPDDPNNFTKEVTITNFRQTDSSPGWELEFVDRNALAERDFDTHADRIRDWRGDFYNMSEEAMYSTGNQHLSYDSKYPVGPYWVFFKKMGDSGKQGTAYVTFETTDSNGITRSFRVNIKTYERSKDGHLTNADVKFEGTEAYKDKVTNQVTVPVSTQAQTLGTVELNKLNASVIPVKFPTGVTYDETTQEVRKTEGVKLTPGEYSFEVRAKDGHFGENAPLRVLHFKVVDVVNPIEHKVWDEGSRITSIPVTMQEGSEITAVRVVSMGDHADLSIDEAKKTVEGVATTPTSANQTVRLEVKYRNNQGGEDTVYTEFTYEVRAKDNRLDLDITNPVQTVEEGKRYQDMVVTTTEGAKLTVITKLPKGLRWDAVNQKLYGRGVEVGSYHVTVLAEKDGLSATKSVHLTVTPGQLAADTYEREVFVGEAIETIFIEKPADARLDFELGAPNLSQFGLKFDQEEATISGTTNRVGYLNWVYTLTRDNQKAYGHIRIKIKDKPIEVNSKEQTLEVGTAIENFTIEASEGAVISSINTNLLPTGVTYDATSKTFSGTPTRVGTFTLPYTASYPGLQGNTTAQGYFVLYVTDKYISVNSGQETVVAGSSITPFTIKPSPDAEIESIDTSALPAGLNYNTETKTFSGAPLKVGTFTIPYRVYYPNLYNNSRASGSYTLTVTDKSIMVSAGNQTVMVGSVMTPLTLTASEGARVSIESDLPRGLSYNQNTRTITGTPTKVGQYILEAKAVYGTIEGNHEARTSFSIEVLPIDATVSVGKDNQKVTLGDTIAPITIGHNILSDLYLSTPYGDVPEQNLNALFREQYGLEYDPVAKQLSGTPNRIGTFEFRVKAKNNADLGGRQATTTFVVTVTPADLDLVISNPIQTILLGNTIRDMVLTFTDGASLQFDASTLPAGLTYNAETQTISGRPTAEGRYDISASVTSEDGRRTRHAVATLDVIHIELPERVQSADPRVNKVIEGDTSVSGTGLADAKVKVFLPNGNEHEVTVAADGTWKVENVPAFEKGQSVVVKQTESGKTESDAISTTAVPKEQAVQSADPRVDEIIEGNTAVSGTGIPDAKVKVTLPNGEIKEVTVAADGTWKVENLPAFEKGQSVVVKQTESGKTESDAISTTAVPQITQGEKGEAGKNGRDGADGKNGENGRDGQDGRDGLDGQDGKSPSVETQRGQDESGHTGTWVIVKDGDGKEISRTFVKDGLDGQDGKSPSVETQRGQDESGHTGTWVIIKDGDGKEISRTFVKDGVSGQGGRDGVDGKDGENGRDGQDGRDGVDGKDGQNGRDGVDGKDGKDGKSPTIHTEPGTDKNGNTGVWIVITDGDGKVTSRDFVRDGQDGKDGQSPTIKTETGKDKDGNEGAWIIIIDGHGKEVERTFIKDGKDGKTPSIKSEPGKDQEGNTGYWIIIKDGDQKETSRIFIKNCGCQKVPNTDQPDPKQPEPETPQKETPRPEEPESNPPTPEQPRPENPQKETPRPEKPKPNKPIPTNEVATPKVPKQPRVPNVLPKETREKVMTKTSSTMTSNGSRTLPTTGSKDLPLLTPLAIASILMGAAGILNVSHRKKENE